MKITSRSSICYVPMQQKMRPDVAKDTSGRNFRSLLAPIKRASFEDLVSLFCFSSKLYLRFR